MQLAYTASRVIDGVSDEPLVDTAVVVDGDAIVRVVPSHQLDPDLEVRALGDVTLLPGLIDCHRHLCLSSAADWDAVFQRETPARAAMRATRNAQDTLRQGITTVRDLGSRHGIGVALRQAIDEGMLPGPRVVASGTPIAMSGGHALYLCRVADGVAEMQRAAREELKAGADVLKLMASGGVLPPSITPGAPQLSVAEMRAAVDEAHNQGKRVAAHAISRQAIENALDAGATSIEHGQYLSQELAARMAEQERYLVPTLAVFFLVHEEGTRRGLPAYVTEPALAAARTGLQAVQMAVSAGVTVGVGTDTGAFLMPHDKWTLLEDLKCFVRAGCSPMRALQAATRDGARVLGLDDRVGTLQAGKFADFVAVEGDPLLDLDVLRQIRLIVKGGVQVV